MEKTNAGSHQWRKGIASCSIAAVFLAFMLVPAAGASSVLSLSTAIASPGDNRGHDSEDHGKHCPPGINHVPPGSHAYDVLKKKCENDNENGDDEDKNHDDKREDKDHDNHHAENKHGDHDE
jgi:hypothetical protein